MVETAGIEFNTWAVAQRWASYVTDVGKNQFWLVLASSGKFWLVLASYGSRGDNFLFKNVKIFKIHKKIAEICRFECGISPRIQYQLICLISLYISFTNVKGNQANQLILDPRGEISHSNQPISANVLWILKFLTFLNRKLSSLQPYDARTSQNLPELAIIIPPHIH